MTNNITGATATKTFTVRSVQAVTVSTSIDLDLGAGTTTEIDMTSAFATYNITNPATEVEGVSIAGQSIPYTINGNKIVYESNMLNMQSTLGEQQLRLSITTAGGDMYDLVQPVVVCSKILKTKEEALNMLSYAILLDGTAEGKVTGYFILGADINVDGGQFGIGYYGSTTINAVHNGVIDGRNHTVSNAKYTQNASGVFGNAQNCTFKNLKMTNVEVAHMGASVLSEGAGGNTVVSNVFIEGKLTGGNSADWGESSLVLGKTSGTLNLTMTNVYVALTATTATDVQFMGTHFGEKVATGTYNNCAALDLTGKGFRMAYTGATMNNSSVVTTKQAGAALTGHSGTAWEAFKAYCQA